MFFALIPSRPRVAKPASRLHNSLKTIVQVVVLWSLALGVVPLAIAWWERWMSWPGFQSLAWCGGAVFVTASLIGLVAANVLVRDGHGTPLPLDTTREFVVAGPYRYVRNPMAMCGILQAVGVGLWLGSPGAIGYAVLGGVLWQYLARPWEEADMEERFGERYKRYRDEVACWIPRLWPYSEGA
jgi:protein-S-isoprenylcysteine O-methyltransferase Ste14